MSTNAEALVTVRSIRSACSRSGSRCSMRRAGKGGVDGCLNRGRSSRGGQPEPLLALAEAVRKSGLLHDLGLGGSGGCSRNLCGNESGLLDFHRGTDLSESLGLSQGDQQFARIVRPSRDSLGQQLRSQSTHGSQ